MIRTIAIAVLLAGCAMQPKYDWVNPSADLPQFEKDRAQCDYETSAATQATDPSMRSIFGQELDRAMRKNALTVQCMKAKGYSQQPR